jgi:4-aminobutyrate aminotransferase
VGAHLMNGLRALQPKQRLVGDVRGMGLMIGIELVRDRQTKARATTERDRLVTECFKRGLLVLGAGPNTLRLCPPLVLSRAEADTAVRIIDESLTAIT